MVIETPPDPTQDAPQPAGDGCPTPLAWQEIVAKFYESRVAWEASTGSGNIKGFTWGSGAPLYLLGGLADTPAMFSLLAWLLREEFSCVFYQFPERASRECTWNAEANDLRAVMRELGHQQIHVFGTAFGARLALECLAREHAIETALLHAPWTAAEFSRPERLALRMATALPCQLRRVPFWLRLQWRMHGRWFPPFDGTRGAFFLQEIGKGRVSAIARRARRLLPVGTTDWSRNLDPVHLLVTEGDGLVAENQQSALVDALPESHIEHMHTAGRLAYLTHPHRLAKLVRDVIFGPTDEGSADGIGTVDG